MSANLTKHTLIQERLNLKRAPLDEWSTQEQLCLASAVACSGDQNWMSVSRALKGIVSSFSSRPTDWFVSKSCAIQYGKLLDNVETPKRKKRTASERDQVEAPSTPVESLVKKLTAERIIELKKVIHEEQQQFQALKEEILFLQSSSTDETRIREMWNQIEQEKIQKEREQVRYDQWLKEREEKKLEMERQWRPNYGLNKSPSVLKTTKSVEEMEIDPIQQQQAGTSSSPSPLLTSLLKSPSQANSTPSTPVPNNVSRTAPTITNLLTTGQLSNANSPLIMQPSTSSAQSTLINAPIASVQSPALVQMQMSNTINIDHSASSIQIPVSQMAPTLITLLDKKSHSAASISIIPEQTQNLMSISVAESSTGAKDVDVKDEEAELLADFNDLINAEKLMDIEDLEDLNTIIMNPEILEDKTPESEPMKDIDDSSQANSTDDYDKRIKQIVEKIQDFAGEQDPETPPQIVQEESQEAKDVHQEPVVDEPMPSEPENSEPPLVDEPPIESNGSPLVKVESPLPQDEANVLLISDESSNTNDDKQKEQLETVETRDVEEPKEPPTVDEPSKEQRAFQEVVAGESDENSGSDKEPIKNLPVYTIDDSDEDILFHDAKENQDDGQKVEPEIPLPEPVETKEVIEEPKPIVDPITLVDSDDEILVTKPGRGTSRRDYSRKKSSAEAPSAPSTRSRDHSENDDNNSNSDSTPIRTRSRHSSTFNFTNEQDHSMWKGKWKECQHQLQELSNYSVVIDSKVIPDDSQKSVFYHPMSLKLIQKNIDNNISTMPGDVKRDFALMCTNIVMWNKKGTKFNDMVSQFMKDGLDIIESYMEVEDLYISYRKQIKKKI